MKFKAQLIAFAYVLLFGVSACSKTEDATATPSPSPSAAAAVKMDLPTNLSIDI